MDQPPQPRIPRPESGHELIQGYGDGGFRVAGNRHEGAIMVSENGVCRWPVTDAGAATVDSFRSLIESAPRPEVVLVGGGDRAGPLATEARAALRDAGIAVETMDTGAACRTFNVLAAEGRRVAAALIPVG